MVVTWIEWRQALNDDYFPLRRVSFHLHVSESECTLPRIILHMDGMAWS